MNVKTSDFAYIIPIGDNKICLFNSLWLRVIFVDDKWLAAIKLMKEGKELSQILLSVPPSQQEELGNFIDQLINEKFVNSTTDDINKLSEIRYLISNSPISIMYLILTERCNLTCSYCFLSEALNNNGKLTNMDIDTARKAIDLFSSLVKENSVENPEIILYGGEPLINLEVVEFVLYYASEKIQNCKFSLNTNGTIIQPKIANLLKKYQVEVGISIDGPENIHDKLRKSRNGSGTFDKAIRGFNILKKHDVNVGISCTISEENVDFLPDIIRWLIEECKIESLGFNLLIKNFRDENEVTDYANRAAKALIECFKIAREAGVYEDRIMRRVNAFVDGEIVLNDCAGCGQQIVVTPDHKIGVCQAFLNSNQNFVEMVDGKDYNNDELWLYWRERSPFNILECQNCEALGICGGGCAYNSFIREGKISATDKIHCIHTKETLRYLLQELYDVAK